MRSRLRPRSYDLTPIAETSGRFADFAPYVPAIDDRGVVAFQATGRRGGTGVFQGDGGPVSPIIESRTTPLRNVCSHPDINASGAACFYAELGAGRRSVVLAQDGGMTIIADNAGPLGPTMNDRGTVAFRADLGPGGSGIYTGRDGLIRSIAATGDVFSAFYGLPVINSHGVVAFRADLTSGAQGIFLGDGGPPVVVAETGLVFSSLGHFPVLDDGGSVAFCAGLAGGGSGVFVASNGHVETAVDTTAAFESFRGVLLGDAGRLVFYGTPRGAQLGVFTGSDPHRDCIARVGGALLDSTIDEFALNPVSINRLGQVAIRVTLASGRQVVVRADPRVPRRPRASRRSLARVNASGSIAGSTVAYAVPADQVRPEPLRSEVQ